MRRPLIECTLTMWIAMVIASYNGIDFTRIIYSLLISLLFIYLVRRLTFRRQDVLVCFLLLSFIFGAEMMHMESLNSKLMQSYNGSVQLKGLVKSIDEYNTILTDVEIDYADNRYLIQNKVLLKHGWNEKTHWNEGDLIQVKGDIQPFENERNPNTFSPRKHYNAKGMYLYIVADEVTVSKEKHSRIYSGLGWIKRKITSQIEAGFNEEDSALIKAILLGDDSSLDENTVDAFRLSGTAHVMAVSGLHFGILYMLICKTLGLFRVSYRRSVIITSLLMGGFVLITGASFSSLRAFSMVMLHQLSISAHRKYDIWNALGLVAMVSIVLRPSLIWSIGFQLSFWAVFSIGLYSKIESELELNPTYSLVLMPMTVQLGLLPIMMYSFNQIPTYSLLFNIPIAVLMPILFILGLCAIGLAKIPLVGPVLIFISEATLETARSLTELVFRLPFHGLVVGSPEYSKMVVFYGILAVCALSFTFRMKLKNQVKRSLPLVLSAVLIVNLAFNILDNDNGITIDFLDVGQGDGALIHLENGQHILIDGGPEKSNLQNILLKQGVTRLDAVFLSHLHSDHYMGLMNCSESIKVESIFHGDVGLDQDIINELMSLYPNTKFTELKRGDSVEYGSVRFNVLHPSKRSDASEYIDDMNPNNLSLTLSMHYSDNTILFTGDIESEVESSLVKTNIGQAPPLDVDILKVAHHGSKNSTHHEFISAFQPEIAVIQVGDNYFGHPASETLKRLQESDVMVYRNDTQGCIRIKLSEKGTEIEPWLVLEH